MKIGIVVATYEWPEALAAVLRGFADQSDSGFDLVVADDGSAAETEAVVREFGVGHVRQDDDGYRLARVRNLGAQAVKGDYLVFVDGDAIPRRGFVRALRQSAAVPGWFLAGKRLELGPELSGEVLAGEPVQRWSLARWALHRGQAQPLSAMTGRDRRRPGREGLPEFAPHADGYGFLLGVSRADFERVNGYDARYAGWGGEDVDMAVRLRRAGLRCGWAGPQSTVIHLWHESRKPGVRPNDGLLAETSSTNRIEAIEGLRELS